MSNDGFICYDDFNKNIKYFYMVVYDDLYKSERTCQNCRKNEALIEISEFKIINSHVCLTNVCLMTPKVENFFTIQKIRDKNFSCIYLCEECINNLGLSRDIAPIVNDILDHKAIKKEGNYT